MSGVIVFNDVSFSYDRSEETVRNISFSVGDDEFLAVVGPNGGGKTTLLKLALGLLHPDYGSITVLGSSPEKNRPRVGYVPQFARFDDSFPIMVWDVVLMGLLKQTSFFPFHSQSDRARARDALEQVGLAEKADKSFGDLSGGQKQRVLIARSIVNSPEILLLDEPVASVDPVVGKDIYAMLAALNEHMTIVMVTHDISVMPRYVSRIGCVNRTMIIHERSDVIAKSISDSFDDGVDFIHHQCGI